MLLDTHSLGFKGAFGLRGLSSETILERVGAPLRLDAVGFHCKLNLVPRRQQVQSEREGGKNGSPVLHGGRDVFRKGRAEGWGRGGEKLSLRLQPQGRKAFPVSFKKSQIRCGETQKMLAPQTHRARSRLGSARSSAPWRRPRVDTRA